MMGNGSMKKALAMRKGKGIDLTIILGSPEMKEKETREDIGMAPEIEVEQEEKMPMNMPMDMGKGNPEMDMESSKPMGSSKMSFSDRVSANMKKKGY